MKKEPGFKVLMMGPRRAGKSSTLSAMLKSLEMLEEQTGFCFQPDKGTKKVMDRKLSALECLYILHAGHPEEPFSTLLGQENGIEYGSFTSEAIPYFFEFSFSGKNGKKSKKKYQVEFTDIPGEHMTSDLEKEGNSVTDRFIKSDVVIVAIDSPALMEGKTKGGVGEFHQMVNIPDSIYNVISVATGKMHENLKKREKIKPKLILFVPLKCEKYYHNGSMAELNARVKQGYQYVFTFLEDCPEYTVAITPILTLGDIVFDHYGTVVKKGKERVSIMGNDRPDGLANMPEFPMYKLRSPECRTLNPKYCEQPLLYICGYIMGIQKYLQKAEKKMQQKQKEKTFRGKAEKLAKMALWLMLFGVYYAIFATVAEITKDRALTESIEKMCGQIKITGDGYELLQDSLGIRDIVKTYQTTIADVPKWTDRLSDSVKARLKKPDVGL